MEEKEFYELEELQQDLKNIKEGTELLKDYDSLLEKIKELKEKEV